MKFSEAFIGARSQIAWIAALTVSTVAIVYLEQLDLGAQEARQREIEAETDARLATEATEALAEAEARVAAAPDDPIAAVSLLLALSSAVQAGALEMEDAKRRADPLWDLAGTAGPEWRPGIIAAALTFAR